MLALDVKGRLTVPVRFKDELMTKAGGRLVAPFDVEPRLRASLRASVAIARPQDAEVSPGLSIRPLQHVPFEIIVERRFRLSAQSRDATAVFVAGGASFEPLRDWTAAVYGQAGVVGGPQTLSIADGAATVRRRVSGSSEIGAGIWGGVQPGAGRLDIGPSASTRLGGPEAALRLSVDWRFRIAGNARPDSGVAVTLAKDF